MSESNKVYCAICTQTFQNSSNIYTTSCGHVYHYECLNDWLNRSETCPQCMSKNPTTHKIFLNFEVDDDNNNLKLRIEELNKQISQSEANFLSLQRQYTESDDLIKKLHDDIQILKDLSTELVEVIKNDQVPADIQTLKIESEFKDMEIAKVQLESSDQNQMFQLQLKDLSTELEKEVTKNDQLSADIQILKIESKFKDMEITKVQLESSDQIKVFEQKLKDLSTDLEKEVTKNAQLSAVIQVLKTDIAFKDLEIVKVKMECADQIKALSADLEKEITKNSKLSADIMKYIESDERVQTCQDDIEIIKIGTEFKDMKLNKIAEDRLECANQFQIIEDSSAKLENKVTKKSQMSGHIKQLDLQIDRLRALLRN